MSSGQANPRDLKAADGPDPAPASPAMRALVPMRQLAEIPKDELIHLAEEYGLEAHRYRTRQHLVAAIHERRQIIAAMERDAMLDVVKWGRRPVPANATKEQLALEIARITTMRFDGLSQRGLVGLARLRGIDAQDDEPVPGLVKKLKRQEGFFSRLNRKRRALIGSLVSNMIGESEADTDYQFLPPQQTHENPSAGGATPGSAARQASIKEEIEDAGLIGGIAGRIKRSADQYLNQKLDEIESRIDRKLDEIDRRLAEWRDKEIANRLRILKITLWATVILAVLSLIYSYFKVHVWG